MNKLFPIVLALLCFGLAKEYEDVIYLKDGSVIYGIIIETKPDEYYKIKSGKNIFVFQIGEIDKISKVEVDKKLNGPGPEKLISKPTSFSIGFNFDQKLSIEESSNEKMSESLTFGLWNMHLGQSQSIFSYMGTGIEFILPFRDDNDIIKTSIISYNLNMGLSIKKIDLFFRIGISSLLSFEVLGESLDVDLNPFKTEWDGGWNYGIGILYGKNIVLSFTTHSLTFRNGKVVNDDYMRMDLQTNSINLSCLLF